MARDLRLFYLFRLLSTSYLYVPVSVFFAIDRGLDFQQVMTLVAIGSVVIIAVDLPTGALADRIGRRRSMLAGALCLVAASLTFYVAHSFWVFAIAVSLAAASLALCSGADSAYLFDLLHENGRGEEYPRLEGTASAFHLTGNAVAFALGGALGHFFGLSLPYLVNAGVAMAALFVAFSMREGRAATPQPIDRARTYRADMYAAMRISFRQHGLRWAILYSSLIFLLLRGTEKIYQPYLESHGFNLLHIGFVFAGVYTVAAVVAHNVHALRGHVSEAALIWGLLSVLVVTFFLLGIVSGSVPLLIVLAFQAGVTGLYSPLIKPLLNREIADSSRRATVLSVESTVRRLAFASFALVLGWVIETKSPAAGLLLSGAVGIVAGAVLLFARREARTAARSPAVVGVVAISDQSREVA